MPGTEITSYEQAVAEHRWEVPPRYNIAQDVCDKHPRDKLAMVHEDPQGNVRELDWGALQDMSDRFAQALVRRGVRPGDRVAMLLPPIPEAAAAFLGTWKAGAILLSMSVLYGDAGIRHRLGDSRPRVLVTDEANAGRVPEGMVAEVVLLGPGGLDDGPTGVAPVDTAADDPAQLYYTSGTTGLAKGILHAHRYILAHEEFVYCHDVRDGERFHGMGEWAWAAGICPLLGPWRLGAVQYVLQRAAGFDPHKQLDFLSRHQVANVFATPTAIRSMMSIADAGTRYPQELRIVCSAGEPLNPEAIRWFREQYGVTVLDYYGLSESYPLVANYPFMEVREGSMGKPMPGWDVAILDEEEQPVTPGERGEICLRANSNPHYPLGYWTGQWPPAAPSPDGAEPPIVTASRETFGGEWFHTKDAASQDEEGYVWYEGRADDVIISAGYRIGPFEVESACLEHPAVAEAAAVAWPDERRGNVVKAFVVAAKGYAPSDELGGEISAFVRERLSAYAYPRLVEFVDDLPKTLTGKIRRIELRQRSKEDTDGQH
ncbi:MAG: AMP-binding protein [Actinomycetota bacterium]|nr:AMP-binding protein [Actinomycetota bacterium]